MVTEFYDEDLAYVHHVGFGDFARQAGERLIPVLQDHGIEEGLVVDLGCGSGIWSAMLLQAGYQVVGVDVSPHMLALAQVNAVGADFQESSVYSFQLPRCRAITALGEVLGYGNERLPTDKQVAELFQQAADCLPVGGLLIFDVIVGHVEDGMDYSDWRTGQYWAVLVGSSENRGLGQVTREIIVFREVNGHYRRSEERHIVRVFNTEQVRRWLATAGFEVMVSNRYGDYRLARRRQAFLAIKKPG